MPQVLRGLEGGGRIQPKEFMSSESPLDREFDSIVDRKNKRGRIRPNRGKGTWSIVYPGGSSEGPFATEDEAKAHVVAWGWEPGNMKVKNRFDKWNDEFNKKMQRLEDQKTVRHPDPERDAAMRKRIEAEQAEIQALHSERQKLHGGQWYSERKKKIKELQAEQAEYMKGSAGPAAPPGQQPLPEGFHPPMSLDQKMQDIYRRPRGGQ